MINAPTSVFAMRQSHDVEYKKNEHQEKALQGLVDDEKCILHTYNSRV